MPYIYIYKIYLKVQTTEATYKILNAREFNEPREKTSLNLEFKDRKTHD